MDKWKCCLYKAYMFWYLISICYGNTQTNSSQFDPYSPRILCNLLPEEFLICAEPEFVNEKNSSLTDDNQPLGTCSISEKNSKHEEVKTTAVLCNVIDDSIQCTGDRKFYKEGIPCVKYTGFCFVTILLQSVFLGCLGVDRFTLGHTGTAVGKLLTLGGVGVWWFVDIILLLTGNLVPADNSNWCIYY